MTSTKLIRTLMRCGALVAIYLLFATSVLNSQAINWDLKDAQEVESNIRGLPTQDQQGIVNRLREKRENLRVMTVKTASGRLFLVQGMGDICGASNCEFWVLSGDYKILLQKSTQSFKLQTSAHNGLPDIVTSMHGSAFESSLSYWRFQGKRYTRIACADAVYGDVDGNDYKKPRISLHPCGIGG